MSKELDKDLLLANVLELGGHMFYAFALFFSGGGCQEKFITELAHEKIKEIEKMLKEAGAKSPLELSIEAEK